MRIIWEQQVGCCANLHQLLDLACLPDVTFVADAPDSIFWERAEYLTPSLITDKLHRKGQLNVRAFSLFGTGFCREEVFHNSIGKILKRIRPTEEVAQLITKFTVARIGIHARQTDHLSSQAITPRWCYLLAAQMALTRYGQEKLYVSTDSQLLAQSLTSIAPGRIEQLHSPYLNAIGNRGTVVGVQHAMADIMRLSQCDILLLSPESTFSRVASYMSQGWSYYVNGIPNSTLKLASWVMSRTRERMRYEPNDDKWSHKQNRDNDYITRKWDLLLTRSICSSPYQDNGTPLLRSHLVRGVNRFLSYTRIN